MHLSAEICVAYQRKKFPRSLALMFLQEPKCFRCRIGRQLQYEKHNNYVTIRSLVEAALLSKPCPLCINSRTNTGLGKQIQKMFHFKMCFLNILMLTFIKLFRTLITEQEKTFQSSWKIFNVPALSRNWDDISNFRHNLTTKTLGNIESCYK